MKKELCKAGESGLLHVPELFDIPDVKWRREWFRKRVAITVCAIGLTVAAVIGGALIFGRIKGTGAGGHQDDGIGNNGIALPEIETERGDHVESEKEIETFTDQTENETHAETESASESESEAPSVIEKDLSEAWRGENFIINFTDEVVDVDALLDRGFVGSEDRGAGAPVVMIIHTHTSEDYIGGGGFFKGPLSVVSVGDVVTDELRRAGLSAIHCTVIHDSGNRNSYLEARETIETMLKIYPSIKYVIDLHRMVISENGIPIKTLSESGAAQLRLSVSAESGGVGDWRESLSLALSLRREMNSGGDGVCMPVILTGGGYNSDMSVYHLVAEVGTDQNSIEEAILAGRLLARAIAEVVVD